MHTYHRLAVEADNEDDAKHIALDFAEAQGWSDWCSIPDDSRMQDGKIATNYKDNPEAFNKLVTVACGWTQETITKAVELYGDIPLSEILTNPKYTFGSFNQPLGELTEEQRDTYLKESLAVFKITRALKVLNSEYDSDTMFYDTVEYTPNPEWVHKRAETDPDKQWIVIVDYHF